MFYNFLSFFIGCILIKKFEVVFWKILRGKNRIDFEDNIKDCDK